MTRRALVLGAGGHAATAWEVGFIAGLLDEGIDVRIADLLVGTSAGAIVAVQLTSGVAIETLFESQVHPAPDELTFRSRVNFNEWRSGFFRAKEGPGGPPDALRRFGSLGLQFDGAPSLAKERRDEIAARLPMREWPERQVLAVAVEAESGARRAFGRSDGIDLLDAVTASCAVPGLWPLVPFEGRHYMDGGVYSIDNADLAAGYDRVLIVSLKARVPPMCVVSLDDAVRELRTAGAEVEAVQPDESAEAAFASVGGNVLDINVRRPAAEAGRAQGRSAADHLRSFWQR